MNTQITLVKTTGSNTHISKRIFLDENGAAQSDGTQCLMVEGTATRTMSNTASSLAEHIAACGSDQGIVLGALKDDLADEVRIVTKQKLDENPGAIARTKEFIDYRPSEPAWVLIDYDRKGMTAEVKGAIEAMGDPWAAISKVSPGLKMAARVSRASTSSGLYRDDTGEQLPSSGGAHHYILVKDGGDIERFLLNLHDRCWLQGLGWHVIGRAGQLLERSPVDRMVASGERLCFEGAPIIEPPLGQDTACRTPEAFDGEAIDTTLIAPPLTEYERQLVSDAKTASANLLGKDAAEVRGKHDRVLAEKLSTKTGMPLASAMRSVAARHRGILLPFVELEFDHIGTVTVADILADPERFIDETLADPMEGISYGRCKAKVMRASEGGVFIHSFAHGRGIYYLRHDLRSAKAAIAKAPADGLVDLAMAIYSTSDMEDDEIYDYASTVATAANVNLRGVLARVKKVKQERDQAQRKATMDAGADGRVIRPRPAQDGELTPTVKFVDDLLAADPSEEPPMRDASGSLVELRVREPWALHQLRADGTNGTLSDTDSMKVPAEPILVQLTPTGVEMLTEQYVRWLVQRKNDHYFCSLPRPYIDALMLLPTSTIPVVRAINTAPLISLSGAVIDGVGLDRHTGLLHRIDPHLRACLPTDDPTEKDVKDAMKFLLDEWMVDVSLDPIGKCVAIMLALTIIERALLPERPAFFITAGQRGGGKTTLANMITRAVLGRGTAAAGWSESAEERKKALFAYLRQGVACLAWDNIARGSAISCSHIEAALTAAETSDRVLGGSKVETVPATTVQIFTGNAITPRGDMASRSLMIALNVDRPDPENRSYTHSDPYAWTQANRAKIVRALYVILIAGALHRPKEQLAKTRFKTWWNLVGSPVEYAASLFGIQLDCTELMRAGEVDDEEASAASAALTITEEIWGVNPFTSGDVVEAIKPASTDSAMNHQIDPEKRAQAETLRDALAELSGKRLDRPGARAIGKLFQAHLIHRPTLISGGKIIAVLSKTSGHNANTFRMILKRTDAPAGSNKTSAGEYGSNDPHIPHIPQNSGPTSRKTGNEGEVGNDFADWDRENMDNSADEDEGLGGGSIMI